MSSSGWAQLRQQARTLESQTESLFHTYSQFSIPSSVASEPSEEESKIESQLGGVLEKRENVISQLSRLLDSEAPLTSSALKQNNLSRHREILAEHRRELMRLRNTIVEARDRANLLSNVRSDISAYRSSNPGAREAEYMLDERRRLDASHNVTDGVLAQAYAINESFATQRETLASINRRIVGAASQVPGINSLMSRISAKKRRDGLILGGFIALCFLVVFFLG